MYKRLKPVSTKLPPPIRIPREPRTFVDRSAKGPEKLARVVTDSIVGIPQEVIDAVLLRSGGRCEMCDTTGGVPFEMSHTIAKGMGGTHGAQSYVIQSAENIRYLCILCHRQLFHNETYYYNKDTPLERSCRTCWLFDTCRETAVLRGILPPD